MASVYQKKNCAALTLALVVFGLMIACLTVPWYFWTVTFTQKFGVGNTAPTNVLLNSSTAMYDLVGTRVENSISKFQKLEHPGA